MNSSDYIRAAAERIKELGFRVFLSGRSDTYGFFSDGKGIGYFQKDDFCGIEIGSRSAPGSECSGYSVDGKGILIENFTKAYLKKAFQKYPDWLPKKARHGVIQYRDFDDFLTRYWDRGNLVEV